MKSNQPILLLYMCHVHHSQMFLAVSRISRMLSFSTFWYFLALNIMTTYASLAELIRFIPTVVPPFRLKMWKMIDHEIYNWISLAFSYHFQHISGTWCFFVRVLGINRVYSLSKSNPLSFKYCMKLNRKSPESSVPVLLTWRIGLHIGFPWQVLYCCLSRLECFKF